MRFQESSHGKEMLADCRGKSQSGGRMSRLPWLVKDE